MMSTGISEERGIGAGAVAGNGEAVERAVTDTGEQGIRRHRAFSEQSFENLRQGSSLSFL